MESVELKDKEIQDLEIKVCLPCLLLLFVKKQSRTNTTVPINQRNCPYFESTAHKYICICLRDIWMPVVVINVYLMEENVNCLNTYPVNGTKAFLNITK